MGFLNKIYGTDGDDILNGGAGDDYIDSLNGNDIISGGPGNDEICHTGVSGNKTIIWNIGDDLDKLVLVTAAHSVIRFGQGITPSDIYFAKAGSDLAIQYKKNANQGMLVQGFWDIFNPYDPNPPFDCIEFADGTTIQVKDVKNGSYASSCKSSQVLPNDGIIRPKKGASKTLGTAGNDKFELFSSVTKATTVSAGAGDDVINVKSTNGHTIKGEAGSDTIIADSANKLSIDGGVGNDTIKLSNGNSGTIKGGDGNDTITVTNVQKLTTVDLGTGNDNLILTNSSLTNLKLVNGTNDVEVNNSTVKTVAGGVGNDTITLGGGTKVTTVNLNSGVNTLSVNGAAITTVNGGKGNNTITVNSGSVTKLNGGSAIDKVTLAVDNTTAKLNAGDDVITVTGSMVKAYGLAGNDNMTVKSGSGSLLDGGVGNDTIIVDSVASTTVTGGKGSDSYILKNLKSNGVITINNATKAKGDVDKLSVDRNANAFTYSVDAKSNLTMTGTDGSKIVVNGWKSNAMSITFQDGVRSAEEVNSFMHKTINVSATKTGKGTAYSDTFIIGAGVKVKATISDFSKYDILNLDNYANCNLGVNAVKNNLVIDLTKDGKALGTITLKNYLTAASKLTNIVVGSAKYAISNATGAWKLVNTASITNAMMSFADAGLAGTTVSLTNEDKEAMAKITGNA